MKQPDYFKLVQKEAISLWDKLEADPRLAGPWHQLFKQVQSPRHVLSELLQNADDANATEAKVEICNGEFLFSHNGDDFVEDQFRSLCNFGFSNKRVLHTIGFRGVGFKSTFSIGDEVKLLTPTLSTAFHRKRFSEPVWINVPHDFPTRTEIHVLIKDERRKVELEKNFLEWLASPVSLLFFRTIRRLQINGKEARWVPSGAGPINNSTWMTLSGDPERKFLLIKSEEKDFPEEALQEVKDERLVLGEEITLPPCRVEIVLGAEGRLFVVLPTGVNTKLPFASNAPFIQDPARVKIKDPEISPTNRWLLGRIGELASYSVLDWLNNETIPPVDRCTSYNLWPDVDRDDTTLEGTCAKTVELEFERITQTRACLLSETGKAELTKQCVTVSPELITVWPAEQVSAFFDAQNRPLLYSSISSENQRKLINWQYVDEIDKSQIIRIIEEKHLPKPETWRQLMILWAFLAEDVTRYYGGHKGVRIVPVQGQDILYAASEVKRLGEKQLLQSDDDWIFLSKYLLVQNPNWTRFLTEQRLNLQKKLDGINNASEKAKQVVDNILSLAELASKVLNALNLAEAADVGKVMEQVTARFFSQKSVQIPECIRLAHIAAKLNAPVTANFQYVAKDNCCHLASNNVVADLASDLDLFTDKDWYQKHVLHEDYFKPSKSCTDTEWQQWVRSERSQLQTFIPINNTSQRIWGRDALRNRLRERGFDKELDFGYKTNNFVFYDYDFDSIHWKVWVDAAKSDGNLWAHIMERLLNQTQRWSKAMSSLAYQVATTGTYRLVTQETILSAWIIKFRNLPCMLDTWGNPHQPAELLRRTPDTEALLGAEPFIMAEIDNEASRPLLQALGVRDTPTGPERLIERIKVLSRASSPPLQEIFKWYQSLDRMVHRCSTEQFQSIKIAFERDKLVLTESGDSTGWARSQEAFLSADESDVPGAAVVHSLVRHLMLWQKLGVAQKPTADLAISWLKSLPSDKVLTSDEARRVRALLPRYPERIWNECQHWLDLDGRWTPVDNLKYARTMKSLVSYAHLFPVVKHNTADLHDLTEEFCRQPPFCHIPRLADNIEEHFKEPLGRLPDAQNRPWIQTLGEGLSRIIMPNDGITNQIRKLGNRLQNTDWQVTDILETVPYLEGNPVGTARAMPALWKETTLYVARQSPAKIAKAVPEELGKLFPDDDIKSAITLCYDRPPDFIAEYLAENFKLQPIEKTDETDAGEAADLPDSGHLPDGGKTSNYSTSPPSGESQNVGGPVGDSEEKDILTGDEGELEPEPAKPPKLPKPPKPSLIELFARKKGFSKHDADRFVYQDGSWLTKANGSIYHWEWRSHSGDVLQYYWVKDHCLEKEPLQIDAAAWSLCEKYPELYSVVLVNPQEEPVEISGQNLINMRKEGKLEVYPAAYRLVYKDEH